MITLLSRPLLLAALTLSSQVAVAQQQAIKPAEDTSHSVLLTTQDLDAAWRKLVRKAGPADTRQAQAMAEDVQRCLFGKPGQARGQGCPPLGQAVTIDEEDAARARKLMRKLGLPGQDRAARP